MIVPKITVVTVCFNAEDVIEKTIESVLNQTYKNLEYIIVDGKSNDKTLEIVERYAKKDNRIVYISEEDKGLYDAMNKGINMSSGDYIEFLNAGDFFNSQNVISDVVEYIGSQKADIYYGDIIYEYPDGKQSKRIYSQFCQTSLYYLLGDCINHQAIFASKDCFSKNNFDISRYRFCADRDWMIRQKKAGKKYKAMGTTICNYSLEPDSQSVKNEKLVFEEARELIKRYYILGYPVYWVVDKIRNSKRMSKMLHMIYELVFLRK